MTSSARPFPYDKEERDVIEALEYALKVGEVGKGLSVKGYLRLIEVGLPDDPREIGRRFHGEYANEAEAREAVLKQYGSLVDFHSDLWGMLLDEGFEALFELDDGRVLVFRPPIGFVWPKGYSGKRNVSKSSK